MYVFSIPSWPGTGDTAEYQASAYLLGIPHPTGFPLYMLLGWAFSHVVAIGTVAWRMNFLTAIFTAGIASGVVVLASVLGARILASAAAGLVFAAVPVVWRGAVHATPHPLATLFALIAISAATAFAAQPRARLLYVGALSIGLGLATQPKVLLTVPALLVAAWFGRATLTRKSIAVACALIAAPLAFYVYLPIRSTVVAAQHLDPAAAPPLNGAGSIDWDTHGPRTLDGFLDEVLGRNENATGSLGKSFDPTLVPKAIAFAIKHERSTYDVVLLLLALAGAISLAQRNRRGLAVAFAGVAFGLLFASVYELDFELERYFTLCYAVTAAIAANATQLRIARISPRTVALTATFVIAADAATTVVNGRDFPGELRGSSIGPIIDAIIRDTPDGAIVVTPWQEGTAAAYAAFIDHRFGSRTLSVTQISEYASSYANWARERPVYLYSDLGNLEDVRALPQESLAEVPSSYPLHHVYRVIPAH